MQPCALTWEKLLNRVTIKDIAQLAGVSHSTVSRSLNDSPLISESTKEKIRVIALEQGFEFNSNARSLSTSKTGTIGIVYPEFMGQFHHTLYADLLINEIRTHLEEDALDSIGTFPYHSRTGESHIQRLVKQRKIDGLLIIHPMVRQEDWDFIENTGIPYVIIHYRPLFLCCDHSNFIFTDNLRGGFIATEALIQAGAGRILCIAIDSSNTEIIERTQGYRAALEQYHLSYQPEDVYLLPCEFDKARDLILELGKHIDPYQGIFVQADLMALGVIEGLKELGLRVPEDIKVVGYDDIELGQYFHPSLTTIHQPHEEQTALACRQLIEMIQGNPGPEPMQQVVEPYIVARESCPVEEKNRQGLQVDKTIKEVKKEGDDVSEETP